MQHVMREQIPVYVINLENRKDRKRHILEQFASKPEFAVKIVKAISHPNGSAGLWRTMKSILTEAMHKGDEFFIMVEDDHYFPLSYSSSSLKEYIILAQTLQADLLLGGVSWFNLAIPRLR